MAQKLLRTDRPTVLHHAGPQYGGNGRIRRFARQGRRRMRRGRGAFMDLLNALVPTAALLAIAALVLPRLAPDRPSMRLAVCTVSLALIARYVWWRLTE